MLTPISLPAAAAATIILLSACTPVVSKSYTAIDPMVRSAPSSSVKSGTAITNGTTVIVTRPVAADPYTQTADLDDDASAWGIYTEISPTWILTNMLMPSLDGKSLRCSITGGAPYSNVHCYRNLPPEPLAAKFTFALSFWYSPTTTFNNQNAPSIVQALEFTMNKWHQFKRYEFALQWQNVGADAPQWRYWASSQWMNLGITDTLESNQWHILVLEGEIIDEQIHYQKFKIDQRDHLISMFVSPADVPGEADRIAVAIQLDGNFEEAPYDMFVDQVSLVRKPIAEVYLPIVFN